MRVLFWSETFWPRLGGVESLAAELLTSLQPRGFDFTVVTSAAPGLPDRDDLRGIPVYRLPFFPDDDHDREVLLQSFVEVSKLKRKIKADLVHINSVGQSVAFHLNTAHVESSPSLVSVHQPPETDPGHWFQRAAESADWIACCSDAVLEQSRRVVPGLETRSSTIRNAIRVPDLKPTPLSLDPPTLLCLGRLVEAKGFDLAIDALATVVKQYSETQLLIGGEGPLRESLSSLTADLKLTDSVKFVGPVARESVPELLNTATLLLNPSRIEGFGLTALEAAMMGRPVIGSRVGGLVEVVDDATTGVLVDGGDSGALARGIIDLLEQPQRLRRLGRQARDRALESFRWETYVDAHESLYRRLAQ